MQLALTSVFIGVLVNSWTCQNGVICGRSKNKFTRRHHIRLLTERALCHHYSNQRQTSLPS